MKDEFRSTFGGVGDASAGDGPCRRGRIRGWRGILGVAGLALIGLLTMQACTMTRTRDGGIIIQVSPDQTITAYGYEDALSQVNDLILGCLTGVPRECTPDEFVTLARIHDGIVKAKGRIFDG